MTDKQEQTPTIKLKDIMARAKVKSSKSIYYRTERGDFRRTGKRGEFYLDARAKKAIALMLNSRSRENAGRQKKD